MTSSYCDSEKQVGGVRDMLRCAVLASGRGSNLEALLHAHRQGELPVEFALVVTDRPGAPAVVRAKSYGLPTLELSPTEVGGVRGFFARLQSELAVRQTELVILAGFMRILPEEFVAQYHGRIINIHPSLLPAFPGLNAQRQALEYGVRYSGCTVHFVDAGVDTGPIIDQAVVKVLPEDTEESLAARILEQEHILLPHCVRLLATGRLRLEGRRVRVLPSGEARATES